MGIDTLLSFRNISPSLPPVVGTAQRRRTAFILLLKSSSQDENLLIKVCLADFVVKEKKSKKILKVKTFKVILE